MTRKDYELIAHALAEVRPPETIDRKAYSGWLVAMIAMRDMLKADNARFDVARFTDAVMK